MTSGYNLGCRSEFLSPPCLFPAWSTRDRENRGDWKTRAALLRSSGQDPPPQPRLLEKQRRHWGRKDGGGRQCRGWSRRGKGGGAEPTTRRPDSDVDRRCCGPSARRRGLGSSPPAAHARGAQAVRRHWEGLLPLGSRARALSCGSGGAGRGAGLRRGRGGEAVSGAGDDDAEAAAAQGGAMAMPTSDAATATVEDSPPAACGRRRRRGSEGSAAHPRRALPPAEIDLPGGGATAAEAASARLGSKT